MTDTSKARFRSAMFPVLVGAMLLAAIPAQANDDIVVTVEAVAKLDLGADVNLLAALNDAWAAEVLVPSRNLHVVAREVEVDPEKLAEEVAHESEELAKDLADEPLVSWAIGRGGALVEDSRAHAWPEGAPTGSGLYANSALRDYLGLDEVHATTQGAGVVVAVLDTGVDAHHELLAGRVLTGWDLVDDDRDASEVTDGVDGDGDGLVDEAHGHGTFVAGVVAQVAPQARILPVRVLDADGRGEPAAVVEGIRLAIDADADVINVSLSLLDEDEPDALKDALDDAKDADVHVVAAGGNLGSEDKVYPAADSDVVSVGAMDIVDESQVVGFSGHGKWVEVAAPGVRVVSAAPGGGYVAWSGTSVAAPMVTAQIALLRSFDPTASRNDVRKALRDTARKMDGRNKVEKGTIDLGASLAKLAD